ncbi:MAG: molybdopterin molybdotransferase MoeA [Acidimicrobiales bacterium]|nr:molybdopterin molybdotransferase MoeA [Acidimicrobiales bacterium]
MTSIDEATRLLDENVEALGSTTVPVVDAVGRVLAAPAVSRHPLPRFDQSAMDGYAVAHADIVDVPVELTVSDVIPARGHATRPSLLAGTATRIFTGGVIPDGADTVVRQESTTRLADDRVRVDEEVAPGTDVRRLGEELAEGSLLAPPGTPLTAGLVAALVIAGVTEVEVRSTPRVAVLVTGDEVVEPGADLAIGQVPDSNGPLVAGTLRRWGVEAGSVARASDEQAGLRAAIEAAAASADVLITTGGVSVGDLDLVPSVAEEAGFRPLFWKVAQRPGGPLYVARRGSTWLFGLPGNPAAVLVNMHVHVRRLLDLLAGTDPERRWRNGICVDPPAPPEGRTLWLRCRYGTDEAGAVQLEPLGRQGSHMLSNLVDADALARIDTAGDPSAGGRVIRWTPLDH